MWCGRYFLPSDFLAHNSRGYQSEVPPTTKLPIPGDNYCSIKGLLSVLNNITPSPSSRGINFGVLAKSHKITVTTGKYPCKIIAALCCMLGLHNATLPTECKLCDSCPPYVHLAKRTTYVGATAFDLKRGFHHLFFYCGVLTWRAIGDVQAPC